MCLLMNFLTEINLKKHVEFLFGRQTNLTVIVPQIVSITLRPPKGAIICICMRDAVKKGDITKGDDL